MFYHPFVDKDGVVIANCARGGINNEAALLDAVNSVKVAKSAVGVYSKEPLDDFSFVLPEKITAAQNLGTSTIEAQENVGIMVLELMIDYLKIGTIKNAVNEI